MLYFKPEVYFKDKISQITESELYKNLKLACDEVYPKRYELKIDLENNSRNFKSYFQKLRDRNFDLELIIHFPETIVTNRDFIKHTIKDLYFIIKFIKTGNSYDLKFTGKRSTYSINEIVSGYNHSHLPSTNLRTINNWKFGTEWCLGASELTNYKNIVNTSKENLQMLLLLIPNYISYESIEGRPYKYLKDVGISKTGLEKVHLLYIERLYKSYKKKLNIKLNNNLEISNFEEFEDSIDINQNDYEDSFFAYKINNVYYPVTQEIHNFKNLDNKFLFNFNGKPIYSKVENKITNIKSKKYAHPAITRYFAKRISKEIKELYHRRYGENCESNNTTESKRTDIVLMQ